VPVPLTRAAPAAGPCPLSVGRPIVACVTARLFTALIPPADIVEALEEFVEPRRDADPQLRWTSASSWHVTTCFLAAVPPDRLDRLVENLAGAAARATPLTVRPTKPSAQAAASRAGLTMRPGWVQRASATR